MSFEDKKAKWMKVAMISYIAALSVALYLIPIISFASSKAKGYDLGDTAMGLFFGVVPILVTVLSFVYGLVAGEYKKLIVIFAAMFAIWVIVPALGGVVLYAIYVAWVAFIGGIGWLIHIIFADRVEDRLYEIMKRGRTGCDVSL